MADQPLTLGVDRQGYDEDPLLGFCFQLDIGEKVAGFFTEVSGVGSENDIVEQKISQKGKPIVRKVPGRLKWTDVSLKRGITAKLDIWEWRQKVIDGKLKDARTTVTIHMLNREYKPVAEWTFVNAWPSKVTGPTFKSDSNEFGVEEVTIVHEGMYRKT